MILEILVPKDPQDQYERMGYRDRPVQMASKVRQGRMKLVLLLLPALMGCLKVMVVWLPRQWKEQTMLHPW